MPKITKSYCDICKSETDGITELKISTSFASKTTIEHTITVNLNVTRRGSVNSVSEPVGDMPDDIICLVCYHRALHDFLRDNLNDKNS
jgi:hypothetical protein